jgi:hypothetical protein
VTNSVNEEIASRPHSWPIVARPMESLVSWLLVLGPPVVLHLLFPLPCPMLTATGLLCPGCGGTRAVYALASGNVQESVELNALVVLVPALAVSYSLLRPMVRRHAPGLTGFRAILTALVLWGLLRNMASIVPLSFHE